MKEQRLSMCVCCSDTLCCVLWSGGVCKSAGVALVYGTVLTDHLWRLGLPLFSTGVSEALCVCVCVDTVCFVCASMIDMNRWICA